MFKPLALALLLCLPAAAGADLLVLSAALAPHLTRVGESVAAVRGLDGAPVKILVGGVLRKDRFFVPDGADQLAVDDQIYLIGRSADIVAGVGASEHERQDDKHENHSGPATRNAWEVVHQTLL